MNRFQLIPAILLLSCAMNPAFSQLGGETALTEPKMKETETSIWVDGGVGLASKGFIVRGGAHVMLRPVTFSLGAGSVSGKALTILSDEWERLNTVHVLASFVFTPPDARVMASFGAGVGHGRYEGRSLTSGGNWLFNPTYETHKATLIDFPIHLTVNFLTRSDLGILLGLEGHVNKEMPTAGLVVGIRFAPIE
jgi:hypothetical protein